MTIGGLAKMTGVETGLLRRLMDKGLIPFKRPPGGFHRRVPDSALPDILKKLEAYGLIEQPTAKTLAKRP